MLLSLLIIFPLIPMAFGVDEYENNTYISKFYSRCRRFLRFFSLVPNNVNAFCGCRIDFVPITGVRKKTVHFKCVDSIERGQVHKFTNTLCLHSHSKC